MIAIALQSGSLGNSIYVEADGVKLLFDAGISGVRAQGRLAARGRDIRDVTALIVSHDHADHARCAGIYQRKFALPIHITAPTLEATEDRLGPIGDVRRFESGDTLRFDGVTVETFSTAHDAVDGVVFVVSAEGTRLGILTDLGHVFDGLRDVIASLDAVFIESNYDPTMLEEGPYPPFLQARIRGPRGHLSNPESAALLQGAASPRLKWACLAHLSENNNTPAVALRTHRRVSSGGYRLRAARYRDATGALEV